MEIVTYVASGALMSLLNLAYIKLFNPPCLFPWNPNMFVIFTRAGGNKDIPSCNKPYPKETAPINRFTVSSLKFAFPLLQIFAT